jgi:hypothetical protein
MRVILFTLMSVACAAVAISATVYRWVDENGVVHYSDQPHENAEKVTVSAPQTYSAPRVPNVPSSSSQPKKSGITYTCSITQPANEDTFPNTTVVTTTAQSSPPPGGGDKLVLTFDGLTVTNFPPGGGSFQLTNLDRGTHTLQAQVQDSSGKVVCQSSAVSFTVLQPSVLNPTNPNFHR